MKRRVFVVASHAPSFTGFRRPLLQAMAESGLEVFAAAPNIFDHDEVVERLQEIGARPVSLEMSRTGLAPWSDFKTLLRMVKQFRLARPDIFLGYTVKPVVWGLIAARLAGVPNRYALITGLGHVFANHSSLKMRIVQWIVFRLYRIGLRGASGVIFQNPDDRDLFRSLKILSKNVAVHVVSGSGVDLKEFSKKPFPGDANKTTFILVARLIYAKGILDYISSAKEVKKEFPNSRFLLVGGEDESNPDAISKNEIAKWREEGVVEWLGESKNVAEELGNSHVFVLPSRYREGIPRSALEALACGRPIITTDSPGCRETVIDGKNGFKVPEGDVEALRQAMRRFLLDPKLIRKMGAASSDLARTRYDVHLVNRDMFKAMRLDGTNLP